MASFEHRTSPNEAIFLLDVWLAEVLNSTQTLGSPSEMPTDLLPKQTVMEQVARDSYLAEFAPGVCEWEALSESIQF